MSGRRMNYFLLLTPEQQQQSVRRLARSGMVDSSIAAATGLSVEQVRRALAHPVASDSGTLGAEIDTAESA